MCSCTGATGIFRESPQRYNGPRLPRERGRFRRRDVLRRQRHCQVRADEHTYHRPLDDCLSRTAQEDQQDQAEGQKIAPFPSREPSKKSVSAANAETVRVKQRQPSPQKLNIAASGSARPEI